MKSRRATVYCSYRPPTVCPRETLFPPRTGSGHDDDYDDVVVLAVLLLQLVVLILVVD
jgi:hypothetical protein